MQWSWAALRSRVSAWPLAAAMVVAACAIAGPIAATLFMARQQGEREEIALLSNAAGELLRLSATTRGQVDAAIAALAATGAEPCSEASISIMRRLAIASTFIQAVGHVEGNRLLCSSLGNHGAGIDLGPAGPPRKSGIRDRTGVRLPFMPNHTVNVYEKNGSAVIVNPNLVTDAMARQRADLVLGVVGLTGPVLLRSHGNFPAGWIRPWRADDTFTERGQLVVVRLGRNREIAAVAAASVAATNARVQALAAMLVPVGLAAGVALAGAFYFLLTRPVTPAVELRGALDRGELFLEYQPVINLQTGVCVGAEALIRWRRADGTLVRPDIFIAEAEDAGCIRAITRFVMDTVERDAPELVGLHPGFHVAINCSAADLESQEFAARVADLIRVPGLAPKNIVIEATERRLFNTELVRSNVAAVRRIGVPVAIDDFGTGYSSLSYLELFRTDFLKIDQSFIGTVGTDAVTSQVVPHIIAMAKSLGMQMIAEGVETEAQARYLRERGVQYAQGWLFARPMSAEALAAFVAQRAREAAPVHD
jgi:sensor c-di-GMP phosphodiesterase-like protein